MTFPEPSATSPTEARQYQIEEPQYQYEETPRGQWRRYVHPNGERFAEFVSYRRVFGIPFVHYTYGRCPETGKRVVATGIIAVGRLARGVIAVGHASMGLVAIGQLAVGFLFGLGQAATGVLAIGQMGLGFLLGLGQAATGYIAVGQCALGEYVLAQFGYGTFVWDTLQADPQAKHFFLDFLP